MTESDPPGAALAAQSQTPRRRAAAANTLFGYTLNTVIVAAQALLLVPLYINALGTHLYGAWLASGEILVWMQALDLGIPNLLIQRVGAAHGRGDMRAVGEWFASSAIVIATIGVIVACLGAILSFGVPGLFVLTRDEASQIQGAFLVGSIAAGGVITSNVAVGLSRGVQDTRFMNAMVVLASIASLIVSLVLIENGFGLWAIAFGLVMRAAVMLVGAGIFVAGVLRAGLAPFARVSRPILRECIVTAPVTAIGGVSYTVMNQSETLLIATLLRPELAVVYSVTRRAADVGRSLVDVFGAATYGGFAHLAASDQRDRAPQVLREIISLRTSIAIVIASAYLAVNASLVAVWVGPGQYGGLLLTMLFAVQSVVLGHSYLVNSLYRALGNVARGSVALVIEMVVRVPLMAISLMIFGLPGLPMAGIVTAATSSAVVSNWIRRALLSLADARDDRAFMTWSTRAVVLGSALMLALYVYQPTWPYIFLAGGLIALLGGSALLAVDPLLLEVRQAVLRSVHLGSG